ncbi:amino acid adenylation domain-containing protein [Ulvibacterium sp.]|uniref:amino acid adenylation domain-containing protein n=1 Tax=Ulvibacterium sp. TaxID=2665914 RepID=UPI0026207320|nr:amino acid adenylation domain-containing protein [Ulvibacterium sp.]
MNINIIDYFNRTTDTYPQKIAVKDMEGELSFSELKTRAQNLGHKINQKYEGVNAPIAIFLPKSTIAITAILGTLYSGNIYAPLDIHNPADRIHAICGQLQPACIITNSQNESKLHNLKDQFPIINLDQLNFNNDDEAPVGYMECIDTDPAYIIHTSGSTGVPKGVVISHRSIFDYINWAIDTFDISQQEIIGNQAPLVFDNSTLDIHLMVFTGATLCLIPEQLFAFPAKLLEYINEHKVNFVFWVPSVLINVAKMRLLESIKIPSLRKLLFAGEVMPMKPLNYWIYNTDDEVLFANLYGPTEITVDCTFYIVDRKFEDDEVLPIGKACKNSDVLILNQQNKPCTINEEGELCVRGSSLALGYWKNPDKTSSVFVQNPLNTSYPEKIYRTGDVVYKNDAGEIIFVGRIDNQIKHLGYRIELGEIEHAISSSFEGIIACVLYDYDYKKIILIYESENEIPVAEFRKQLIKGLSKYMIPSQYFRLEKMPLNASGKIDRKALSNRLKKKEFT